MLNSTQIHTLIAGFSTLSAPSRVILFIRDVQPSTVRPSKRHREVSQAVSCFRGRTHRRCAQRGNTVEASRRAARASARANDTARADDRADGAARARDAARVDLAARNGARTRADARADDAVARAVGAVGAVCVLGAGAAVVAEGVGVVETCPLAIPPRRERKRSLSTPPSRDDGGVERRQCRGARQLASRLWPVDPSLTEHDQHVVEPGADLQTAPASAARLRALNSVTSSRHGRNACPPCARAWRRPLATAHAARAFVETRGWN